MRKVATIYAEETVRGHRRAEEIFARFPRADVVWCDQYSEVFNPRAQNFRLQKGQPALILAKKTSGYVMNAPDEYNVGGRENYYFSHMLNCVYDCRYCFLQGMYRSAHFLLFVNFEDFAQAISAKLSAVTDEGQAWFFSGYDCDSLAFDPVTRFADYFLDFFSQHPHGYLELRTKSTQIRPLLRRTPLANVIVACSFTPESLGRVLEHGVPRFDLRLDALRRLQDAGWQIGLRFDPLVYVDRYQELYEELITRIMSTLDPDRVHSVSVGSFRMPKGYFKTVVRLYPDEPLYATPMETAPDGMVSYPSEQKEKLLDHVVALLLQWIPPSRIFNHEQGVSA